MPSTWAEIASDARSCDAKLASVGLQLHALRGRAFHLEQRLRVQQAMALSAADVAAQGQAPAVAPSSALAFAGGDASSLEQHAFAIREAMAAFEQRARHAAEGHVDRVPARDVTETRACPPRQCAVRATELVVSRARALIAANASKFPRAMRNAPRPWANTTTAERASLREVQAALAALPPAISEPLS